MPDVSIEKEVNGKIVSRITFSGRDVRKIIIGKWDEKMVYYVGYCNTSDVFVSPPFNDPEEFAAYAAENLTAWGNIEASKNMWLKEVVNTDKFYLMTEDAIQRYLKYLAKLEQGESLADDEAFEFYGFTKFLESTVAPHQNVDYEEISDEVVNQWIRELEMLNQYPEGWAEDGSILDNAKGRAYYNSYFDKIYPELFAGYDSQKYSTQEQCNKLAGRYLHQLAKIAGIFGANKRSPLEIIEYFLHYSNKIE